MIGPDNCSACGKPRAEHLRSSSPCSYVAPPQRLHTRENWEEAISAMQSGARILIDEDLFDHFLNVLPPVYMNRHVGLPGEAIARRVDFGFAEGADLITAFWREGTRKTGLRYFCQRTKEMNRG